MNNMNLSKIVDNEEEEEEELNRRKKVAVVTIMVAYFIFKYKRKKRKILRNLTIVKDMLSQRYIHSEESDTACTNMTRTNRATFHHLDCDNGFEIGESSMFESMNTRTPEANKQKVKGKRRRTHELDEDIMIIAAEMKNIAHQLGRNMKEEYNDKLYEKIMDCFPTLTLEGYSQDNFMLAFRFLAKNADVAGFFIRSVESYRISWLRSYFNSNM